MKHYKTITLLLAAFFTANIFAQAPLKSETYQAFLQNDAAKWSEIASKFEKSANLNKTADVLQLVNYYYTWTSVLISKKQKALAEKNIQQVEKWIDNVLEKEPDNALALNYKGVFLSYQISLNRAKAPLLGKRSLKFIQKAYSIAPNNVQILFDNGNAYYYPPKMFGGDKKLALRYFQKAISILEKEKDTEKNWLYIQIQMQAARCNELLGNLKTAKAEYEKILRIEPNFKPVRDTLYPELLKKMN